MRWLVVHPGPAFSVHDVHVGWVEALRELGQQVHEFNLDDRLTFFGSVLKETRSPGVFERALTSEQSYEMAAESLYSTLYQVWPDVLLVVSGFFIPPQLLDRARRTRTRVVILHTESPYEDDRQIALAAHGCAHVHLINDPINIERWRASTDDQVFWMPNAYRPSVHHAKNRDPWCSVAWVGSMWPERFEWWRRFLAARPGHVSVALAGNFLEIDEDHALARHLVHPPEHIYSNVEGAALYRCASLGVNTYRKQAQRPELVDGWAMSPREVEMVACGLPYVSEPRGEHASTIPDMPTFDTPEEAADLCAWLSGRPGEQGKLAKQAASALEDRTFYNSARYLLGHLDKEMR